MQVYLDTSALAKWYINEARSERFSVWICDQQDTHISSLTAAELRCLLSRRRRMGDIEPEFEQHLFTVFRADVKAGHLIEHPVEDSHVTNSIDIMNRALPVPLRTLDAIHLSIAIAVGCKALATADIAMATAAQALDLQVFDFGR